MNKKALGYFPWQNHVILKNQTKRVKEVERGEGRDRIGRR